MLVAANHRLSRHPDIARDDIAAGEMLLLDGGHCLSGQLIQACTGGGEDSDADPARLQFIGGSLEAVIRMVASGHGATLIPELATLTLPTDVQALLHPFKEPIPARQVSLITHGEGIKTRLLALLRDAILAGVPGHLKQKDPAWTVMDVRAA